MIDEAYAFEKIMKRKQDISLKNEETSIKKCKYCGREFDILKPPYNYLWKHVSGYYCGAECSACETVTLMNFTDSRKKAVRNVLEIEKHFDAYKEESK